MTLCEPSKGYVVVKAVNVLLLVESIFNGILSSDTFISKSLFVELVISMLNLKDSLQSTEILSKQSLRKN